MTFVNANPRDPRPDASEAEQAAYRARYDDAARRAGYAGGTFEASAIDEAIAAALVRLAASIDARCDAELARCRRDAQRNRRSIGQLFKRNRTL